MEARFRRRLASPAYTHPTAIFSITTATRDRARVFTDARVAAGAVAILRERSAFHLVRVLAFCVMPDHVHILMSPSRSCDVPTFVGQFKNLAQRRAWTLGVRGAFWQHSFHDRALRHEDDVATAVRYILNNPVRAGLAHSSSEYPFSGGELARLIDNVGD